MSGPEPEGAQSVLAKAFADGQVGDLAPLEKRVDTHLSHVFLIKDRAYKLKRAVRLPFVDFSTITQRREACEAELAVNRAWAAPLYLGVAPITRAGERFGIDGKGDIVDWVVVMRRFKSGDQFDELGEAGQLSSEMVEDAAAMIAGLHAAAAPDLLMGHVADYRGIIAGLRTTEADGAARLGVAPAAPHVFERLEHELARVGSLIEARRAAGKVRRGHGDLHLRNLCLFEGAPLAFDALEFDRRMSTMDVLYDVAFLLMDLTKRGFAQHASAALNAYWNAAREDEEALKLLPFFMGLRAAVRMAVSVEAGALADADAYRRCAMELLGSFAARRIAIGGLSGSGKSAVARAVAPLLPGPAGARLLRSDVVRKTLSPASDRYAPHNVAAVYEEMARRARAASEAGASVIVDATFQDAGARSVIAAAWRQPWRGYWLDAPRAVRLARVGARRGDVSDADVAVAAAQDEPGMVPAPWRRLNANRAVDLVAADIVNDRQAGDPAC